MHPHRAIIIRRHDDVAAMDETAALDDDAPRSTPKDRRLPHHAAALRADLPRGQRLGFGGVSGAVVVHPAGDSVHRRHIDCAYCLVLAAFADCSRLQRRRQRLSVCESAEATEIRTAAVATLLSSMQIVPFVRWHRRRVPFRTTPHKFKAECVRSTLETARTRAAAAGIDGVEPFSWRLRSLGNQVTVSYLYPKHWSMSGAAVFRQNVGEISHQLALTS